MVVGEDEQNVWPLRLGLNQGRNSHEQGEQYDETLFHWHRNVRDNLPAVGRLVKRITF
jgi:hypothetical protein